MQSTRSELAAAYTGIMAVAVLNVMPALAGVLSIGLGWDERLIGRFASVDSVGALAGTLLAAALMRSLSFRLLSVAGMVVLALADVASGLAESATALLIARLVGGLGGGLAMGISFSVFATSNPERGIAIWSIGQLVFGFTAITALPRLTAALGWQSVFYCLAAIAAPSLVLARHLPAVPLPPATADVPESVADGIGLRACIGVIGVGVFYFGQGSMWPYLEVIGLKSGIEQSSVEESLSVSAASAILGSMFVLLAGNRFGRTTPVLVSLVITLAAISTVGRADPLVFRLALAAFTFCWPVFAAYQFALIVTNSRSGRVGAFVTTANFAGLMLGPAVAGELAAATGMRGVQWLAAAMDCVAMLTLIPLMRRASA